MDLREPPLGGSRGTDPQDLVVWFGSTTHGWQQRILTLGGIRHRGGEDAHSKHVTASRRLVCARYGLPMGDEPNPSTVDHHEITHVNSSGVENGSRPSSCNMWLPVPRPKHIVYDHKRSTGAGDHVTTTDTESNISTGDDHAVIQLGMRPSSSSSQGKRQHNATQEQHDALRVSILDDSPPNFGAIDESPSLMLFRRVESEERTDTQDISTTLDQGKNILTSAQKSRKSVVGSSLAKRRPTSATSTTTSLKSSIAPTEPRSSHGPQSIDDFPSATLCRDLSATIALRRAAAIIDRVDRGEDVDGTRSDTRQHQHHHRHQHGHKTAQELSSSDASASPDGSMTATAPSTTLATLRKELGSSMMHTIRSTNSHHAQNLRNSGLDDAATAAATHAQRMALERLTYKHLPRDETERLKLRDQLEKMQTEFAKREIEADLDNFKLRAARSKKGSNGGSGGSSSGGSLLVGSGGGHQGGDALGSAQSSAALLNEMLNAAQSGTEKETTRRGGARGEHGRRQFSAKASNGGTSSAKLSLPASHLYRLQTDSRNTVNPLAIPAQSRVSFGNKTFVYSELFRPSVE